MEQVTCALCGSSEWKIVYKIPDLMLERINIIATFVKCNRCGLVFQNPRPTEQEMKDHYPPQYSPYRRMQRGPVHGLLEWVGKYGLQKRCNRVLKFLDGGRLLDIGCAKGEFLETMQNHPGWDLTGVEVNSEAADRAHLVTGLPVFTGTLKSTHFPSASFDAITLWDVFEHLHHPSNSLDEIKQILTSKGYLFLRIPNLDSYDSEMFGPYWVGWESPRHLFIFTPKTISQLLIQHGFQVVNIDCGIGDYQNFMLSIRLWLTARGVSPTIRRYLHAFLNSLPIKALLAPLFAVRSHHLRGSSLLVTAQKGEEND